MGKKGQVRMTETVAILFIFFVLILFGLLFFFQFQKASLKEEKQELLASRAMDSTLLALYFPELQCSKGEAEPETNCFDLLQLEHVNKTLSKHQQYYFSLFSYARIYVNETFPDASHSWVIYDNPKQNYTSVEPTYFVIALRDSLAGSASSPAYRFAYLTVEAYS